MKHSPDWRKYGVVEEVVMQLHMHAGYSCGVPLNGGHRSVKMCLQKQLTGDLLDHELPV